MIRTLIVRPAVRAALDKTRDQEAQLLLVAGPPGCGKSASTEQWVKSLDTPFLIIRLADANDVATLLARVAAALGMSENVDTTSVQHALGSLGAHTIVLDDFDRLVASAQPTLAQWREAAPRVRWVVTSRQRLDLDDMDIVDVGPMTTQQAQALFVGRARQARPDFTLDVALEAVVRELVDELDCIPLAVELAAARSNALGPAEILARLPQRFRILRDRGKTLEGTIALSWDLLRDVERETLRQCIVFRGGFSTAAAESILELDGDDWVVDVLQGLVEKSLLRSVTPDGLVGEVRFEMLTSLREFVMSGSPLGPDVSGRHARHYLEKCRRWTYEMRRRGGADARTRLGLEQANLVAAFEAASEPADIVDLALTLDKTFRLRGAHATWELVLERAAQQELSDASTALVQRALGELRLLRGQFDAAMDALNAAADAATSASEWVTLAWTCFLRGEVERRRGNAAAAHAELLRAIDLAESHSIANVQRMALGHAAGCLVDLGRLEAAREAIATMEGIAPSDDLRDEARLLKRVAYAQHYLGNPDEQTRLTERALELSHESGDRRLEALCIQGLGDAAFVAGEFDETRARWAEALAMHRALGSAELEGALLGNLGNLEHRVDRTDEARRAYRQALELHARTGARPYEAVVLFALGVLELELGHFEDAARALDRGARLNQDIGNVSDYGSCRLVGAWAIDASGGESSALREEARAAFAQAGDDDWVRLCALSPDVAGVEDSTVLMCACALRGEAVEDRSRLHVRAALAAAQPATERPPPTDPGLRLANDAEWFEADGERISLRRRRAPRHILARLIESRLKQPGAALDVETAFRVGWPDEIATVEAANDRVYWAIRTLRKLGLDGYLVTSGDGYLLDPNLPISVE